MSYDIEAHTTRGGTTLIEPYYGARAKKPYRQLGGRGEPIYQSGNIELRVIAV